MNMDKDFDLEIAEKFFERGKNRIIFEKYSDAIEDFTKTRRKVPCFSYGDVRRKKICFVIKICV